jgi:hypothetical protein
MESRVRRAAEKNGLRAIKSRWRRGTKDNKGGWQIIEPRTREVVAGEQFDLTDASALGFLS